MGLRCLKRWRETHTVAVLSPGESEHDWGWPRGHRASWAPRPCWAAWVNVRVWGGLPSSDMDRGTAGIWEGQACGGMSAWPAGSGPDGN